MSLACLARPHDPALSPGPTSARQDLLRAACRMAAVALVLVLLWLAS